MRYLGLVRNQAHLHLVVVAWNLLRATTLAQA